MFYNRLVKLLISLVLIVMLILGNMIPVIGETSPAYAANLLKTQQINFSEAADGNSLTDWHQVDQSLIDAIRDAYDKTETFVTSELEVWEENLMEKVDDKFLNWYFNYFNQKAQEFGIPFAWLAFKIDDTLKLLRRDDEKDLTANEILRKRMIADLNEKFNELVLNSKTKASLNRLIERVGVNYTTLVNLEFTQVRNIYKISGEEWERHLSQLAAVAYDTGDSRGTFSPESFISNLTSKLFIGSTAFVGSKVLLSFAAKAATKMAAKAGGAVAGKVIAQSIDPVLAVGILLWDVWDYNQTVKESRPLLRQNILDFVNEIKWSILYSPDNSIMAGIKDVEGEILALLS